MFSMLAAQLRVSATIRAAAYTTANAATLDGTSVDIGELEGSLILVVDAALASTGESMAFAVQHSYDGTTWAAVPAAALVNAETGVATTITVNTASVAVNDRVALKRDLLRRFVRVQGTATGNGTPAYAIAAYIAGLRKYAS